MATSDGRTADDGERWRDMPDGITTLDGEHVRALRSMLAFDRSPGRAETLHRLGLASTQHLDAVVLHGAPVEMVERVTKRLDEIRAEGGERQPPVDYRAHYRALANPPPAERAPGPAPSEPPVFTASPETPGLTETRAEYLARRGGR